MSDRDPARIEAELEATRARLGANLDELTRRLSPGQLLDEGLAYLRTNQGTEFVRNLGTQVRDNPLPVTVTALGIGWLALSSSLERMQPSPRSRAVVPYDPQRAAAQRELAERAHRAGAGVSRMADETEDAFRHRIAEAQAGVMGLVRRTEENAESFMQRVQEALDAARHAAESGYQQVRDTTGAWADAAGSGAQQVRSAAGGMLERGRQGMSRAGSYASRLGESSSGAGSALLQSPVLLSAIGVAAGALFGALLPPTEVEKRYLGEATERAAHTARDTANDVVQRGANVARAAMDAGYQAAREQGLTPGAGENRDKGGSEEPTVRH